MVGLLLVWLYVWLFELRLGFAGLWLLLCDCRFGLFDVFGWLVVRGIVLGAWLALLVVRVLGLWFYRFGYIWLFCYGLLSGDCWLFVIWLHVAGGCFDLVSLRWVLDVVVLVYLVVSYCVIIAGLLCLFVVDCWWCIGGWVVGGVCCGCIAFVGWIFCVLCWVVGS